METYLTIAKRPFGIPYHRAADEADSHSYIDLAREPNRIDEIPEARQVPAIRRLLEVMNAPESIIKSLGCASFLYPPNPAQQKPWTTYTYVGYCFRELAANSDAARFFPHFYHFTSENQVRDDLDATVSFELRQTVFIEEETQAWTMDFIVQAFADTEAELNRKIAATLGAFLAFLPRMGLVAAE